VTGDGDCGEIGGIKIGRGKNFIYKMNMQAVEMAGVKL
jgi:hypothetical protein